MKYNSRRFILTLIGLALITFLVWHGKIDSGTFGMAFVASVGAYLGANTWEKMKKEK